jgi:hypothetical protein
MPRTKGTVMASGGPTRFLSQARSDGETGRGRHVMDPGMCSNSMFEVAAPTAAY